MKELIPVDYGGQRVLTTEQLAEAYECEPNNIKKNFNSNKDHFVEGRHYYKVDGEELNDLRVTFSDLQISPKTRCLYLWTRRGASRHSKMLGTDKAWEMFDALEENYFNSRPKALTPAEQMAQGLIAAQQLLAEKDSTIAKQSQLIGELKPAADYTDRILQNKSLVTITQIAKDYGISGAAMNAKLHEMGVIYKLGGQWLLYSKYQAKGYTHSETVDITHSDGRADVKMNTKWTQKGRLFLYQHLKKHGILPVIEQDQQPALTIVR